MCLFLLNAAVDGHVASNIMWAVHTIQSYSATEDNLCFRLVQQFTRICALHLDGEHNAALKLAAAGDLALDFVADGVEKNSALGQALRNCLHAIEATDWENLA
jgi:hypothetical protein